MQNLRWLERDFLTLTDVKCDTGLVKPGDIDMCIVSKGTQNKGLLINSSYPVWGQGVYFSEIIIVIQY